MKTSIPFRALKAILLSFIICTSGTHGHAETVASTLWNKYTFVTNADATYWEGQIFTTGEAASYLNWITIQFASATFDPSSDFTLSLYETTFDGISPLPSGRTIAEFTYTIDSVEEFYTTMTFTPTSLVNLDSNTAYIFAPTPQSGPKIPVLIGRNPVDNPSVYIAPGSGWSLGPYNPFSTDGGENWSYYVPPTQQYLTMAIDVQFIPEPSAGHFMGSIGIAALGFWGRERFRLKKAGNSETC